jgi:hypothetical protein
MKRLMILAAAFAASAVAQMGVAVSATDDPPARAIVTQAFYDGSGNFAYACKAVQADPRRAATAWSVGAGLTNIVVSGNVATATFTTVPGLYPHARVTLTGSATAALNGTYTLTAASGSTVTFATSGVGNATYTDATVTSTWPLLTSAVWAIKVYAYDGSNRYAGESYAADTVSYSLKCSDRGNY